MKLDFDIQHVKVTEFGVGRDDRKGQSFVMVAVDSDVQTALREMTRATSEAMHKDDGEPAKYEPSEKHGGIENIYLAIGDDLAITIRELHEADNLQIDGHALDDPTAVFCYFARLRDKTGRRLTALRRATQFKGVVKSRLIRFVTDALKLIEDRVFKLDTDFDLLVDSAHVHILRPSGFEFAGKLQQAILDAVPENIKAIQKISDRGFQRDRGVRGPASTGRAYLASIRAQAETKNIDESALKKLCKSTGVEVADARGKIAVALGHELGFLKVLDRRRYQLELVKGQPERFKAASRRKLNG